MNIIEGHIQNIFGCSSANFHKYPDLWMANIELYIPQIFEFIERYTDYNSNIVNMSVYDNTDISLKLSDDIAPNVKAAGSSDFSFIFKGIGDVIDDVSCLSLLLLLVNK